MSARREDIDDFDVWYMHEHEGKSLRAIAKHFNTAYSTIYYRLHPEKEKERAKQRRLEHPEYGKEYIKQRWQENPESLKQASKKWQLKNPEYMKEASKEFKLKHPEYGKEWWQSDTGKIAARKYHAKHRSLGSIELNKPFDGSEGHHIDDTYIIHMPKELHRIIYHNVFTGEGMEAINEIAFIYITEDTFDKLIAGEI